MRRYLLDTGPLGAYLQVGSLLLTSLFPGSGAEKQQRVSWSTASSSSTSRACTTIPPGIWGGDGLLGAIYPYFLTYSILERYAEIRRTLRPPHGSGLIGDIDTLIAATALERAPFGRDHRC